MAIGCTQNVRGDEITSFGGGSESSAGPTSTSTAAADDSDTPGGDDAATAALTSSSGRSSGDDTAGIVFDVGTFETGTTGGWIPGQGSCRPSEAYGAAGARPSFSDPDYADMGETVVLTTWNSNYIDGYVLGVIDVSGAPPPPSINFWANFYHHPSWTRQNLGSIYGLTLDSDGDIFVAATSVYGTNTNPGRIFKIDGVTGQISTLVDLPNNFPSIGNINYDCVSETIYASNHEDGRIYQIDMSGSVVSTYHHGSGDVTTGPANDPGEPDGAFAPLGDRVWAVQSHAGRLYYGVWNEDSGHQSAAVANEVWSVAYVDESGVPDPVTAQLEVTMPGINGSQYSNPVSDISFAATGAMLAAERTMINDAQSSAHQSTNYEFEYSGGAWVLLGTTYVIGELPNSAAGGVDHDFEPGGYVWLTGDALDFYTPDVVYGLQGTPHDGGTIANSTLIDLDGEVTQQDKSLIGDVEIPIPGDALPPPPPVG